MPNYEPSLSERKSKLFEDIKEEMMTAGNGGFTSAAPAEGPVAGYDPVMGKVDRVLKKRKKKEVKEETLEEARDGKSAKDKGYSLHDWFKGGGWKQTGGKYDGKPCAKQPGQTTKPFCRDADDRAAMSKDERDRRAAKKRREDPNADRKGKAKMVHEDTKTELQARASKGDKAAMEKLKKLRAAGKIGYERMEPKRDIPDMDRIEGLKESENLEEKKDACYHKVKARYDVWPSAYASGALVKCRKKGASNWGKKSKKKD